MGLEDLMVGDYVTLKSYKDSSYYNVMLWMDKKI